MTASFSAFRSFSSSWSDSRSRLFWATSSWSFCSSSRSAWVASTYSVSWSTISWSWRATADIISVFRANSEKLLELSSTARVSALPVLYKARTRWANRSKVS